MKVFFTLLARDDLIEIGSFIARGNEERAVSFVKEIVACCEALAALPQAFPVVTVVSGRDIRRRPFGRYLIFYRADASSVEILRIVHGARDLSTILEAP